MINTNFAALLGDLQKEGKSNRWVCDRVGCSYPTINKLANGKLIDPVFSVGAGIIQLHDYYCKEGK